MLNQLCNRSLIKEIFFVFVALLTYLLVGINRSYLAFLFHQLELPDSLIKIDEEDKSWIASFISLLSPLGCIISGLFMDILGRKLFIQIIFVPFILSWLLITFAKSVSLIYAGIMIQGISGGMSFCVATYIAEICIPHHRGALLSVIEIMYSLGILLSNVLMYYFKWNLVSIIFVALSLFGLLMTISLPESPVWLYSKGKHDKSIEILCNIRCQQRYELEFEIREMELSCSQKFKTCSKQTFRNCLRSWKPFVILSLMFIILQSTGYPIMLAFTITIVDRLNIPYESSSIAILFAVSIFIGSLTTPYFMHKLGRKIVLAVSGLGMAASMIIIALYEEIVQVRDNQWSWIVPLALFVYIFVCIVGVLPVGFVMGGELFPLEVRGVMNGLYGATGYVYSSVMMKAYPRFLSLFGIKATIWTFASFSLLAASFGIFILPETKGKTLNEVQEKYFKKNKTVDDESAEEANEKNSYRLKLGHVNETKQ